MGDCGIQSDNILAMCFREVEGWEEISYVLSDGTHVPEPVEKTEGA